MTLSTMDAAVRELIADPTVAGITTRIRPVEPWAFQAIVCVFKMLNNLARCGSPNLALVQLTS